MKKNRRGFLKISGLAGLSAAGASILPGCNSGADAGVGADTRDEKVLKKNWSADPEWHKVKYGDWVDPGISDGPGPMDEVLLKNHAPISSIVAEKTFVPKAMFPVIDVNIRNNPEAQKEKSPEEALADWVKTQEEVGVETSVLLTKATGAEFDRLVELYLKPYPDRFQLYCGLETTDMDKLDYPKRAVEELERCYEKGARGIGELSDKGLGMTYNSKLAPDERLHPDDERLDPFWEKAAELKLPVSIHLADHPSAWEKPDVFQERTPIWQRFNRYGKEGLSFEELQAILPRLLKKHPKTNFISCHLANLGHDLGRLGKLMDQHPNLYVDTAARDYELGRQPRAAAKFLTKYPDRVLFGTLSHGMNKTMYQAWWRLLETADDHMEGRIWWRYYGLDLPPSVLESLYYGNARKIMNWEKV